MIEVIQVLPQAHKALPEVTAGWPFEAVRSFESAETTEARLDLTTSLQRMPSSEDVWKYLTKYPANYLLVSPYIAHDHLLDIRTVGKQEQLMAKALMVLAPVRADWGTASYSEAFNWSTVIEALKLLVRAENLIWREKFFYTIAFRSVLGPTADYARLIGLDEKAHAEATKSGGLLKYWFGEPDINRKNLATCIWRKEEDAKRAGSSEIHVKARKVTGNYFAEWKVERHLLVIAANVNEWRLEVQDN